MSPEQHMSLKSIQQELRQFNADRDWGQYHSPRNLAMALSVEASELLELYLWSSDDGPQPPVVERRPKVAEEAADVFICLMNFCERADVNILKAVRSKIQSNAVKYPIEKVKGRLEKHSEYPKDDSPTTDEE